MKQAFKSILLCTTVLAALTACSPEKTKEKQTINLSAAAQMQSDELTAAGEQLIAPHTFHLADRAFALALEKNPNDKKAQFYRALLKRFMVFRGVLTNVRPLVEQAGNVAQFDKEMAKIPNSPIRSFLFLSKGSEVKLMNKEEDLQKLLMDYSNALQEFRTFVAKNQDLKLDLQLNPVLVSGRIQEDMADNCHVIPGTQEEDGQLECDMTDVATIRVNVADLLVMKQEAAGEMLYATLYTAYNANGVAAYSKEINAKIEKDGKEPSAKESADLLQAKVSLKLLNADGLKSIRTLGADLGVAAKWVLKYQSSVCPKSQDGQPLQRKGYLVKNGICVDDASLLERNLSLLEQILKGSIAVTIGEGENAPVKQLNFLAPFDKPVADLRALAPATWNADGSAATSLKDKTLNGLFPNGDAESILVIDQNQK